MSAGTAGIVAAFAVTLAFMLWKEMKYRKRRKELKQAEDYLPLHPRSKR